MPPKKGTGGVIEAGKIQLARVKSRERGRGFNFVLDGEVVNRCKNRKKVAETGSAPNVGKKGQATNAKMDHQDEMAVKLVL